MNEMNEVKPIPFEAHIEIAEAYHEFVKKVIAIADKHELDRNRVMKSTLIAGELAAENINLNDLEGDENE